MATQHTLYIVATPIGHRQDLSMRAVEILSSVSRIYAEDTRHSQQLLRHYGIETRLHALHEHNEAARAQAVVKYLQTGGSAALITDAGTPLISDPGYRLVRACHDAGIVVSPIPGASALTAALSVSGLPTDRFLFVGFPPAKSAARRQWLEPLAVAGHTLILFESPHRIVGSLSDLAEVLGADREMTLARELTKRFETLIHGRIDEVLLRVKEDPNQQRGEFVLVVAGSSSAVLSASETETDRLLLTLLKHMPVKTVAKCAAEISGISRKQAYDRAIDLQGKN
ncbi:MAG: 16S rRNA (cytidine(1402)-2'-O)-methyltransferase [Granulosicoccus sp.]